MSGNSLAKKIKVGMVEKSGVVLIKLGGSVITNKHIENIANNGVLNQLAAEIRLARQAGADDLVLVHGTGSFGHPPSHKYKMVEGLTYPFSLTGFAAVLKADAKLHQMVMKSLVEAGNFAVTMQPLSFIVARNRRIRSMFMPPVLSLLENGMMPVTYGDLVLDSKQGCADLSSEQIINFLASRLRSNGLNPKRIIHVGKTDGVYDLDGKTISAITPDNYRTASQAISGSDAIDVTGGMRHKVAEAYRLARRGIPSLIISASEGNLTKAILGETVQGTWVTY